MLMLSVGIKGEQRRVVAETDTAAALSSGYLQVLATPVMIAMMEHTANESVAPFLKEGQATVGTAIDIKHVAPTPVGVEVTYESELVEVDRRRLVFKCRAYDAAGDIGFGTQERFVVDIDRFIATSEAKKAQFSH